MSAESCFYTNKPYVAALLTKARVLEKIVSNSLYRCKAASMAGVVGVVGEDGAGSVELLG